MTLLPNYFEYINKITSPEIIILLEIIEENFILLNYNDHQEDITSVFQDTKSKTSKELVDATISYYREHIDNVLSLQGIFLANPFSDKLASIVELLTATTKLGTTPLLELLEGETIDDENSSDIYFAKIIAFTSNLIITEVLQLVDHILVDIIDYLKNDIPLLELKTKNSQIAEIRFKNSLLIKQGIIVDNIRHLSCFGYNLNSFIKNHSLAISNLESDEQIANEIILLVLGSNTDTKQVESVCYDLSEHIGNHLNQIILINNYIKHYFINNSL